MHHRGANLGDVLGPRIEAEFVANHALAEIVERRTVAIVEQYAIAAWAILLLIAVVLVWRWLRRRRDTPRE